MAKRVIHRMTWNNERWSPLCEMCNPQLAKSAFDEKYLTSNGWDVTCKECKSCSFNGVPVRRPQLKLVEAV